MRPMRSLLTACALALMVGCGGTTEPVNSGTDGGTVSTDGGKIAFGKPCTTESTTSTECETGLCTIVSYDRSTTPLCTYKCDATNMNPMCPTGCNPKGYCKIQL